jgi:sugar phosphate isomerase/epimerase
MENAMTTLPLAIQMYTLRTLTQPLLDTLMAVAAAGYTGIEPFGPLSPPAPEFRALLQKSGLQVCSSHVALAQLEAELEAVVAYHDVLGNKTLVVPWLGAEDRPTSKEGWQAFGRRLDALGARTRALGARLLYHNHDFEMVRFDGRTALQILADAASPENLGLEIDAGWVVAGGADPIELLHEYAGRVPRLHAKEAWPADMSMEEAGAQDVGSGLVDWPAVLQTALETGVEWVVAEHDDPIDPLLSMRRSADYLAERMANLSIDE